MNYKHTLEAAMANLDDIMNLLKNLSEKGVVSSIEIDLALQKTRNLYEVLLLLKQDENKQPKSDHPGKVTVPRTGKVTERSPEAKESDGSAEEMFEISPEEPVEHESSVRIPDEKKKEKKILSDSLKSKAVLGESLHQGIQYQDLSSHLHAKPVTDLAKAIGINEKFLYIRELFGNDSRKFEKAIQIINSAPNFNEAFNYMIREYDWDMDSELVQGLLEIVRRKYITGPHE
jgi:hypothetical protein